MVKANREGVLFIIFCGDEQIRTRLTKYPKGESKVEVQKLRECQKEEVRMKGDTYFIGRIYALFDL